MRLCLGAITILFLIVVSGCSGGADIPTSPQYASTRAASTAQTHMLWGFYQFTADPEAESLDFITLRAADMHLNVLPFLEPPPFVNLSLESLVFNGNSVDANIGIRHPFPGFDEFTGFDVCGILISRGSISGFTDPKLRLPGENDVHLLNPDGYSRWWNPAEFPINDGSWFSYKDGLLGTPHSIGKYNATLNPYKYFCDDLHSPDAALSTVSPTGRGVFSAGKKIVRHYSIRLGASGLIFNYAIDACWEFPDGSEPWDVPADFPPAANRPEAWYIAPEILNNSLWNDGTDKGGALSLSIKIYDWFNPSNNILTVESPGNFTAVTGITPTGGGTGYAKYNADIAAATPSEGEIKILITAASEEKGYGGLIPGADISAYQLLTVPVENAPPEELEAMGTATIEPYFDGFGPEATADDPIPTEWYLTLDASLSTGPIAQYRWEMDGDDLYDDAAGVITHAGFPLSGTHVIKLKVISATSGKYAIYELPGSYVVVPGTYISCQQC